MFNTVLPAAAGKLILDGKTIELTPVCARQSPSEFDGKSQTTGVLAAAAKDKIAAQTSAAAKACTTFQIAVMKGYKAGLILKTVTRCFMLHDDTRCVWQVK